jgi:iron complex outermembrane recepter protein
MIRTDRSFWAALLGIALLAPALPVVAQTAAVASATSLEEVVVTGIRYSLEKSLEEKRANTGNVEVIKSDDIGKLPDKNVADALQRLPGVNTASAAGGEGGFDENDRVAIRGTSPSLTQTTINGHAVASGDWFLLDQFQLVGRSVSYTLLPSEMVDTVVVHKSQSADMTEGGVSGSINIETRRPLVFKKDLTAEAFVGAQYGSLGEKSSPQANGLLAWKNADSTFGVLGQVFYEERKIRRDGQEFLGYTTIPATIAGPTPGSMIPNPMVTAFPALAGAAIPTEIGSALFTQTRKREGGTLDLQFAPNDRLSFDLNGFYSDLKADNYNRNYMAFLVNQVNNSAVPSSATVANGTVVAAAWPAGTPNTIVYDEISRPGADARTYYIDLTGNYNANDRLTLLGQVGYTHGIGNTPTQPAYEACQSGALSYDMSGGISHPATVTYAGSGSPAGASTCWAWNDIAKATDEESYAQGDAIWKVNSGVFDSVKAGVRYAVHKHIVKFPENGGCLGTCWSTFPTYGGGLYPSNFASGIGGGPLTNIWQLDESAIASYVAANVSTGPSRYYWPGESDVEENDWAAYAMAIIGGDGWKGNFGVRVVSTHEWSLVNVSGGSNPITTSAFGPYTPTAFSNDYLDFLPSANLKFDLTKDLVLKFSAAQTMARPDYSALGGAVSLTDLNWVGTGGNPNLKPIRSANYDSSIEWYFAPQALLSFGLFYMDMSSYVDYQTSQINFYNQFYKQTGPYTITSPYNTTAQDKGYELAYQQTIWHGFGVQANFTHATGKTAAGTPLVGASNTTYNVTGFYEDRRLSARLAYTYRSNYLVGLDRSFNENQDSIGSLDASINFRVTDALRISIDGLNLTDETLKYYGNNTSQPRAFYSNGRQYYAGFHFVY